MLPIARLREFLLHPDADIRFAAARYFHGTQDCGDATMEDWWAVVDALGFDAARLLLHSLRSLPETDASVARLLSELREGVPAEAWFPLCRRLENLPLDLLERHIGEVREVSHRITPTCLAHLEARLALRDAPPEALWEMLMAHAKDCGNSGEDVEDPALVSRLTEALARHPEFSTPRMLEIFGDESIDDWREVFAMQLAGALRCHEAIEPLLARMRMDDDSLLDYGRDALLQISDPGIPARIAEKWEDESWDFRLFAHDIIASFRSAESAALLRDLIARDPDESHQIFIAIALLETLPDDPSTLEFLRQLTLSRPEDEAIEQLDLLLATVATMTGWTFPEHAEWRAEAIAEAERMSGFQDREEGVAEKIRTGMLAGLSFREAGGSEFDFGDGDDEDLLGLYDDDEGDGVPRLPFVREEPKVGRNDPCPCNSGKKFKKCCGKEA